MSRSRSLLSGAFVVVLASYVLGLFALIASGMASQALREQVANTAGLAPALMTAFVCFAAARNTLLESRVRAAWRWIALACLCAWFGDASWFVIESLMHQQPQASVADIGYLSFYPIMMVGLLAFPHAARSRSDRLKMWLDVALIVCACAAALWQFAVSPDRLANHKNLAVFTVTVSQPIGDLVTLLGVTVLWLRRSGGPRDRVITLLVLGVMTNVVADMFYAYQVRAGTYESGGFIEVAWVVNYLLIALAAFSERDDATSVGDKPHRAQRPLLTMAMPYLAIGLVSLMLVRLVFADGNLNLQVAVIATTVMTALVVVRQMAATRENLRLNAEVTAAEGEQRLHSLIQNSTDVIAILDVDATVRYVSPSLERLAGIPGSAIIGQRLIDNIHPDDQSKAILFFATLAKDGVVDLRGEWRMATVSGDWRLTENVGSNLMNEPTVKGLVLNTRDITERQALETQLRYQAFHDPLTGAANRSLFSDRVEHAFRRSSRDRRAMAVLFIDLDNFKHINDTLGHAAGDEVLKVVSQRMRACLREGDTLARLGGDEFAVLLEDLTDVADADVAGERIIESLKRPIPLANGNPVVGASIGVTGGADGSSAEQLLRNADVAMYVAKSKQKGTHKRFTADMQNKVMERLELEADLRRAVQENQFVLQYQPIVGLSAGNLSSVEALMRWDHPTKGRLQPGSFIKVAEETGLITQMGRWALGEATRQVRRWQQASGLRSAWA